MANYRRKTRYHYREQRRQELVFNSEPLTLQGPKPVDIENEKALIKVLKEADCMKESKINQKNREYVLQELNQTCQDWVVSSARKHNHPEEFVRNSRVRLYAFGSYKLDVHSRRDDVDLLCVGPRFLTRDMFFDELVPMLQSNSCITNFYAVREAYVPVISFNYNDVAIDIVYGQLQIDLLDDKWDITDDRNLRNLDNQSILSLNGVRLANCTLEMVPNKKVFRLSLRAIRYWAKQRAIYSNKLGYLGGVSWAILTARVCQLYPNANASQIVQNFFLFYHIWNFGSPFKAITLNNIKHHEDMPSIKVWDPNDTSTRYELMHIITPAFPAMNSTHNVSMSTFEVLKREIARGFHSLSRAQNTIDEDRWKNLFSRHTFFMDHKHYIFIKSCAPRKNLTGWSGLIESKIRSMVTSLEQFPDVKVTPFCKAINLKLKKEDINAHTHPEVLKELEEKRKALIAKRKALKLEMKEKAAERQRLEALQKRLAKEREEERLKKQAESETTASATEREQSGSVSLEAIGSGDSVQDGTTTIGENGDSNQNQQQQQVDSSAVIKKEESNQSMTSSPIKNTEIVPNGLSNPSTKGMKESPIKISATPTPSPPTADPVADDDVILVSNLSMPIAHKSPTPPPAPTPPKPVVANSQSTKPRRSSTPIIQTVTTSQPANPYIYVAPELQRRYGGRRGRYNRGSGRNSRYGSNRTSFSRTYSSGGSSKGGSPAPSVASNGSDKKSDREGSVGPKGSSTSPMIPHVNPNAHAFVVGKKKDHIACCQTFNNAELARKAKKYDYQCRAFVIGLKTMNRVLGIETMDDGTQIEQRQRFDFTASVSSFLKNLNHDFTDSHVIIQRIPCNKVPHYLFPQYDNRRPGKEVMLKHQQHCEEMSKLWKSKSCIATIPSASASLNGSPTKGTPNETTNATPNGTPSKEGGASKVLSPKLIASPEGSKDADILMNDEDVDVMPGLGLPPAESPEKKEKKSIKSLNPMNAENMNGNGHNAVSNGNTSDSSNTTVTTANSNGSNKRSVDEMVNKEVNVNGNNVNGNVDGQPPAKRMKLMNGHSVKTEIIEHPLTVHPSRLGLVNHNGTTAAMVTAKKEEEEINYSNPYFKQIDWDKKFDDSLTFDYALKLYRKSQSFTTWSAVSHDITATANHVVNTCLDQQWKGKLKKVLMHEKYGWSGAGFGVPLSKKLMFELAHDLAFNYVNHRKQKKKKNWAF